MDLTKAIQMYYQNPDYGKLCREFGLTQAQVYLLDLGIRNGKSQAELELKINMVNDRMKSWEIAKILEEEKLC